MKAAKEALVSTVELKAKVAEAGKVDLVLGGHWHAYARQVSDTPEVGAATVYLTHQGLTFLTPET